MPPLTDSPPGQWEQEQEEIHKRTLITEAVADALKVLAPGIKFNDQIAARFVLMLEKRGLTLAFRRSE